MSWMRGLLPVLLAGAGVAAQEQAQFSLEQPTIYAAANSSTVNCDKAVSAASIHMLFAIDRNDS
jgi:hypothetical protein